MPEPQTRIYQDEMGALVCTRRLMQEDERAPRDEAVLSNLTRAVSALTQAAAAVRAMST